MAPNPNECVALMQQQDAVMVVGGQVVTLGVGVKVPIQVTVMRAASGDDCSEDGEHFYDASSEVQSDDNDANGGGGGSGGDGDGSNKDSGVDTDKDNSCGSYDVPDPVLAAQIVEQVEYYFSDAHILKDAFLLKHARRNRDGYISLKLITSFKKVKHVTKDWRVVAHACRQSTQLGVNEAGTKVRRLAPLPDTDETSPSRTIVAIGIPSDKATMEGVAEMFAGVGRIALIRILRPGSAIPPDVRQCANRNHDMQALWSAVVEFEAADSARQALRQGVAASEATLRLVELASRRSAKNSPATSRPATPSQHVITPPLIINAGGGVGRDAGDARRRRVRAVSMKVGDNYLAAESSDVEDRCAYLGRRREVSNVINIAKPASSASTTPTHSPQQRRHYYAIDRSSACRQKSVSYSEPSSPASTSPWVQRRLAAAGGATTASPSSSPPSSASLSESSYSRSPVMTHMADNRLSVPCNLIRLPYGPDGSRGFQFRSRPRSASAPEVERV